MPNFYETERAVSEYLLFHYGNKADVLPLGGPEAALDYPVRCVSECLDTQLLPAQARGLDLGCAVGRATFELARHCHTVVGIDFSQRFVEIATLLQEAGSMMFSFADEGDLTAKGTATVPPDIERGRVTFLEGDAQNLPAYIGQIDVVLMANLIDRLQNPLLCLVEIEPFIRSGGQLIITSPYTWLADYTPKAHWLGGFVRNNRDVHTFDTLSEILLPRFELLRRKNLPFLIREHARKYQWSIAEATVWRKK
jgi:putative 4-mercaptohistidine N1-methyltranferase